MKNIAIHFLNGFFFQIPDSQVYFQCFAKCSWNVHFFDWSFGNMNISICNVNVFIFVLWMFCKWFTSCCSSVKFPFSLKRREKKKEKRFTDIFLNLICKHLSNHPECSSQLLKLTKQCLLFQLLLGYCRPVAVLHKSLKKKKSLYTTVDRI